MKVHDLMNEKLRVCGFNTNLAEAVAIMWEGDCGILPVITENGEVEAVITDRDIAMALGTRNQCAYEISVSEVMTGKAQTCAPEDDIHTALNIMRKAKVRRLPVVNGNGKLEGLLSLNDVAIQAESYDGRKTVTVSYEDVVNTLKAICEHRPTEAVEKAQTIAT
jgi:predicted transcriptional regulator